MASTFGAARKRRSTNLSSFVPLLVGLLVLVLVVGLVRAVVNRWEPLGAGALVLPPGTEVPDERPDNVPTFRVSWREGQVVTYGVTVRNSSPVDVRVTDVAAPGARSDVDATLVRVRTADPARRSFRPREGEAFRPFTLESGSERWLLVDVKVTGCQPKAKPVRLERMPLTWSAWGIDRVSQVPLGMAVELAPAPNCGRPAPKK